VPELPFNVAGQEQLGDAPAGQIARPTLRRNVLETPVAHLAPRHPRT